MLTDEQKKQVEGLSWFHRIELEPGYFTPGIVKHGPDGGDWPTTRFLLPVDLTGKSVLDIGCADGFFSFEAERRGATSIIGLDTWSSKYCPHTAVSGFSPSKLAKELLSSKVQFYYWEIENNPLPTYQADVTLLYGVIYHGKRPLEILEHAAHATKQTLIIESAYVPGDGPACLFWKPGHNNDPTNQFYPNKAFIHLFATRTGFEVTQTYYSDERATWRLDRRKEVPWP